MSGVTEARIMEALKGVKEPKRNQDIVSLGMISGLIIKDGNVGFAIEVDPKEGPAMEPLRKAAEQAVHGLDGVTSVTAVLTAEKSSRRRRPLRPASGARTAGRRVARFLAGALPVR